MLAARGLPLRRLERIEPSLEDAFVAIIEASARARPTAGEPDDGPAGLRRSLRTIRAILRREFIDVLRDPRSLALTLMWPISMLVMYGYGIRYDVDNVPISILDYSETSESRDLAEQMLRSGYFTVVRFARDQREIDRDLMDDSGAGGDRDPARVLGSDPRRRADGGAGPDRRRRLEHRDDRAGLRARDRESVRHHAPSDRSASTTAAPPIQIASRIWYNPELKSVNFIVPGVIAVIMMIVGAILTALSIVKEKERGTIEQILVSPIRPLEMMIGKLVPYMVIALIDLAIIICAGYLLFGVPIKGSIVQLALFALLYLFCALGVGVFVSTIADTMQNAMLAAIFLSLLPSVLLSGFVFPLEDLPGPIQARLVLLSGPLLRDRDPGHLSEARGARGAVAGGRAARRVRRDHRRVQRRPFPGTSGIARLSNPACSPRSPASSRSSGKEVVQIRRDRRMFGIVLLMPVLELFIFGYVVATEVDDVALAVCDYSHSAESRAYVDQLTESGYFRIAAKCTGVNDADRLLDRGEAKLVLAIPPDFAEQLRRRRARPGDGGRRRQQLQHRDDRARLPGADHALAGGRRAARRQEHSASRPRRAIPWSRSSRAPGSTPSSGASTSWCPPLPACS